MESETINVVLPLVGVVVGFAGGFAVEWLRGLQATRREARDRRERFQVETLTRLQEILSEHYDAMLDYVGAARRTSQGLRLDWDALKQRADAAGRLAHCYSDIILLISRVHAPQIIGLQDAYWRAAEAAGEENQTEELRGKRIDATQKLYAMLQATTGRELQAILSQARRPARGPVGWLRRRSPKRRDMSERSAGESGSAETRAEPSSEP